MQEWGAVLLLLLLIVAAWPHGWVFVLTPLAFLLLLVTALAVRSSRERQRTRFVNQLKSCRKELRGGGSVLIDGQIVRYRAVLTTYRFVVGGLFFSVLIPSQYRLRDRGASTEAYLYSVCSCLSGWFSLPYGPLVTLGTVLQNVGGGEQISVAMLIDGEEQEAHKMPQQPKKESDPGKKPAVPTTGLQSPSQERLAEKQYASGTPRLKKESRERILAVAERLLGKNPPTHRSPEAAPAEHPCKLPEQIARRLKAPKS